MGRRNVDEFVQVAGDDKGNTRGASVINVVTSAFILRVSSESRL